ncbi:MAG TPA: MFS transporter [Anaerolineales bacterium]|nr:MFS transporter [Anaerolineales bacterium]
MIWLGQMVSGIASSITAVALPIWIFSLTNSGAAVGLLEFFFFGSYILATLFAGVLIDRSDRKTMMLMYDFLSLSGLAILLVLQTAGLLQVWHLYASAIFQGVGSAFQSPSYAAAITTMVPRKQYIRANSLMSLLYDIPGIFGPLLAGMMYLVIGLSGILAINLIAFVISIGVLLFVEVPPTPHTIEGQLSHNKFLNEAIYGIKYIFQRPGLLGLQLIFFTGNLFSGIALSVAALYPMILLRTGHNTEILGTVQSAGALASVIVGIFLTTWGGIKRPVRVIIVGWILSSFFSMTLLGVGQVLWIWLIAVVIDSMFDPIVNVSMDAFLQAKVPPDLQGRVFSASDFIAQAMIPFTPLMAGYFGDKVFEPAMKTGGALVNLFGWLVGTGPGSGFGLLILLCGIGGTLVGLTGYLMPSIRNVDKLLPDFRRLPPIGMIRRAPLLRIRKGERKTKPRKAIRLRERTPLAPKEELKDNGSKPEKTIRLKK